MKGEKGARTLQIGLLDSLNELNLMKFFKDGKILSEVNKIKILPTTSKNKI
jgi:hypothetical protein